MDNQKDFFDEFISDETEIDESEVDGELEELEELGELEELEELEDGEDVELRTVLLKKNEMLAMLGLRQSTAAGTIVRIDPRKPIPSTQRYDNAAAALKWFNRSLASSKRNGWEVVFDGKPMYG